MLGTAGRAGGAKTGIADDGSGLVFSHLGQSHRLGTCPVNSGIRGHVHAGFDLALQIIGGGHLVARFGRNKKCDQPTSEKYPPHDQGGIGRSKTKPDGKPRP